MLIYDYIELKEELFKYITDGKSPYAVENIGGYVKSYYSIFGQTVIKIYTNNTNSYQYFINSAHPV